MISFVPGSLFRPGELHDEGGGVAVARTLRILWMTMVPYVSPHRQLLPNTVSTIPLS